MMFSAASIALVSCTDPSLTGPSYRNAAITSYLNKQVICALSIRKFKVYYTFILVTVTEIIRDQGSLRLL